MDSTAQTPPWDSEIINELLSRVTDGFDNPNCPLGHQRTAVMCDAWIRQPKEPTDSEIINELVSWVIDGCDSH